jgi:hypothetical protein
MKRLQNIRQRAAGILSAEENAGGNRTAGKMPAARFFAAAK